MRQTRIYNYFAFGFNYNNLRRVTAGGRMRGAPDSLEGMLGSFLRGCEELDLKVTRQASAPLVRALALAQQAEADDVVPEDFAARVRMGCAQIDVTLDSELRLRNAYVVTQKRVEVEHLQTNPAALMGEGVFVKLPELCRFDFEEGCRCIAFERPTAAAFHLMRALEGMLRHYFLAKVKRGRPKILLWNSMITILQARRDAPPKPLLDHLDNIRDNFRNPTQHPEARYTTDGAQDLLAVCIDAMNRMVRDLEGDSSATGAGAA